jgi:hypothetical protein
MGSKTAQRVYLVQCSATGLVKIGMAADVMARVRDMQTGSSSELVPLLDVAGGRDLERELHLNFASKRVRGEWFRLTDDDVAGVLMDAAARHFDIIVTELRKLDAEAADGFVSVEAEERRALCLRYLREPLRVTSPASAR